MDTLFSMQVFTKVVETENFAEAARRLGLSPAKVTRHIQSLEQRLGARLINRTTHRFSLTEAGAGYHERCVKLLAELEIAEESVRSLSNLPRGRLRLTAPADLGRVELWPLVRDFMQRHPQIQVDLVLTNRVADLVEEEFDLAIRTTDGMLDGSLIARKLATSRTFLCASPDYLRSHGVPQSPDDLMHHRCLLFGSGRHQGWVLSRDGETQRLRVPGCLQANQVRLLRRAAVDGMGIAMQPTFSMWEDLAAGRLQTLLEEWRADTISLYIVYPSRRFLPAKTRLFIDFLAEAFDNDPDHDPWLARALREPPGGRRGRARGRRAA